METEDVMAEALGIAEDRWDEQPDYLPGTFLATAGAWWELVLTLQRVHLMVILNRLHVAPRVGMFLAKHWPWRLLPRFDPDKWRAERSDH